MKFKLLWKWMIFVFTVLFMVLPSISAIPNYLLPSSLQRGDLLFMDVQNDSSKWAIKGLHNDHVAIYIGNNTFVNAIYPEVQIVDFDFFYNWAKNFAYARVKSASSLQRQSAVDFALSQLGAGYQTFFDPPWFGLKIANPNHWHPMADFWYCMELAWASYYNQCVDIDKNGWAFPRRVTGDDILGDDDIEVYCRDISIEIKNPRKGIYIANQKIIPTIYRTIVFGSIDIEVNVSDCDIIKRVEFYINNVYHANDSTIPFSWNWIGGPFGKGVIKAVGYDNDGNRYFTEIMVWKFIGGKSII